MTRILKLSFILSMLLIIMASLNISYAQYALSLESNNNIPIYFREYGVLISRVDKLGDTIHYQKSSIENFKIVFRDVKGSCHYQRYVKGILFEEGNYANSLDTLKRYVSGRTNYGVPTPISVQSYFEPLKNGVWISYKSKKQTIQTYEMGVEQ